MAFSLVTRFVPRRSSPSASSGHSFHVLGFRPATTSSPGASISSTPESITRLLLYTMAGQGPSSLAVTNVPDYILLTEVDRYFRILDGYLGARPMTQGVTGRSSGLLVDVIIEFSTASDAAKAFARHSHVLLSDGIHTVVPFDEGHLLDSTTSTATTFMLFDSPASDDGRPCKRRKHDDRDSTKLACNICFEDINGPYSTPCRQCKKPRCYECVKKQFVMAIRDHEEMPARCCGSVLHHEVSRQILPRSQFEMYKQRYDEFKTMNPLYCPISTCSTFIPPRTIHAKDEKINCHNCHTTICVKCKHQALTGHSCPVKDVRVTILEAFHYKACPRCGTGVMKMFGCPHVRCPCGAHWCWDCRRPMNICYLKPCHTRRIDTGEPDPGADGGGDGNDNSSDTERDVSGTNEQYPSSDVEPIRLEERGTGSEPGPSRTNEAIQNDGHQTITTTAGHAAEERAVPSVEGDNGNAIPPLTEQNVDHFSLPEEAGHSSEPREVVQLPDRVVNLDDPDELDWETASISFGDEPQDEPWDTWGCNHHFQSLHRDSLPENWMVGIELKAEKELSVECMNCFGVAEITDKPKDQENKDSVLWESDSEAAGETMTKGNVTAADGKAVKAKGKTHPTSTAFECTLCGVVYCHSCKEFALRWVEKQQRQTG